MIKKTFGLLLSAALVGGVLIALPAQAQPTVPEEVQIDDPFGDANAGVPMQPTGMDLSTVADIGKVWFSNTADKISVHIQTEVPRGPNTATGNTYEVYTNPPAEGAKCLLFYAALPGGVGGMGTLAGGPNVKLLDRCEGGDSSVFTTGAEGEFAIDTLADGKGLVTLTFPREHSKLLAPGGVLTKPHAITRAAVGATRVAGQPAGFLQVVVDNTPDGSDYTLQDAGEGQPSPSPSPTATEQPPEEEKPKKCPPKKGKGKKKKKKCPKAPSGPPPCPVYTPGEQGAEAETSIVTDAATEEAPVEVEIDTAAGGPAAGPVDEQSHAFHNIQVDSAAAEAGLYVRWEFDTGQDYDIYLNNPDGSEVASAAGFNQAMVIPGDPAGGSDDNSGGHSEADAEALDGVKSADCQGYTLDIAGFLTEGGAYTLKLWLGEATYPAEEAVMTAINRLV